MGYASTWLSKVHGNLAEKIGSAVSMPVHATCNDLEALGHGKAKLAYKHRARLFAGPHRVAVSPRLARGRGRR